ncbi:flagellar export protein FliJ [Klenkia marina]|uniref:Flagellar export protein FliJ n=1 Tax=Klenkia marina TaxID=1960309 RepID=A0A1G4XB52_9ACTN|nr:flagellar export protein FliJ [Klenkia marina]SCX38387.1 flagellar export protein FliJ [Klenkia marina]
MKKAGFRLQPVLELRRAQERTAALAAVQAAAAAARHEQQAVEVAAALSSAAVPRQLDGATFVATMVGLRALAADEVDARATARATAEQAEAVRAGWTAAAQATKALERLAERHRLAAARAELAAEERAADDVVTGRYRTSRREEDAWRD